MGPGRCGSGLARIVACLFGLLTLATVGAAQSSSPPSAPPPSTGAQAPATSSQDDDTGGFVFKKEVEEVVLHAIVVDPQNHLITGLARDNFKVYEDGKPQELTSFRKERVPVSLGILIDN